MSTCGYMCAYTKSYGLLLILQTMYGLHNRGMGKWNCCHLTALSNLTTINDALSYMITHCYGSILLIYSIHLYMRTWIFKIIVTINYFWLPTRQTVYMGIMISQKLLALHTWRQRKENDHHFHHWPLYIIINVTRGITE